MAIFGNHIKGTGNAESNTTGVWTWIKWSKPENKAAIPATLTDALSPEIKVKIGNGDPDEATSLGNIVTTKANITTYGHGEVYGAGDVYNSGSIYGNGTITGNGTGKAKQTTLNDDFTILLPNTGGLAETNAKSLIIKENNAPNSKDYFFQLKHGSNSGRKFYINGDIAETGNVTLGKNKYLKATGDIQTTQKCEALYFNATSDKRAKENIQPATFSGLDLINKLSLYTFNYKNTTGTVPGILAQDLLEVQPEELSLVDNIAATGENGDYMSIKEGKLIFVLMQAIKEQQAQIDDLKAQIKDLTK